MKEADNRHHYFKGTYGLYVTIWNNLIYSNRQPCYLKGFRFDSDDQWHEGKIYDPESGKTYSCYLSLKDKNGFIKNSLHICIMQLLRDIPPKEIAAGLKGYYAHGSSMTLGYVEIKAGSNLAEHKHEHEQITYIISGELDMIVGGIIYHLKTGMYHVIPSNVLHGAHAITDCKVIDVFNPVREDYKV